MQSSSVRKLTLLLALAGLAAFVGGCKKNVPTAPPAATPAAPAAQPTVTLNAAPTAINGGQSSTLSWSSTNATDLDIQPGVGKVSPEGSTPVTPQQSTTYTITASGPGGSTTATAHVDVNAAPAEQPAPSASEAELFDQNVRDAFFDLDKSDIRPDARDALTKDAEFLRSYPDIRISLEGHCDERGSTEYNLGLGQRRAEAAKNYLVSLGIPGNRIDTVSWGKERPFCTDHNESCWQQNRRGHFVMVK
jgi:peptidoglycan-associated lipoprotein